MIHTLLVDEQKVIREGLRVLLESEPDIEIVAAVSNGYAAISQIEETHPDILFISIKLSEIDGLDVLAIIRKKFPQVKIIIFTDQVNEQHLIQSLEIGIKGYLLKDSPMEEIVESIYAVNKGYIHIANGAFQTVIPQIAQTFNEINQPKPEIIFNDTAEYEELAEEESSDLTIPNYSNSLTATNELISSNLPASNETTTPFLLEEKLNNNQDNTHFSLSSSSENTKNQKHKYFSIISLASVGLLTLSLVTISIISRRSPQVVIENAVINGKTIPISSPILGTLSEFNYRKGAFVTAETTIATIEPIISDRIKQEKAQLETQINLKKQQQDLARQSLSFLASNLQNIEEESNLSLNPTFTNLIANLHRNQLKYQETALKTAQIREDAAQQNYEDLKQLYQENRISESQIISAQNSWELAKSAITEINTNLENIRQEYIIIKQQLNDSNSQNNSQIYQKKSLLNQQIESQQATLKILQVELEELENKLATVTSQAEQKQSIVLKAPVSGAFYTQQYTVGEIVDSSKPIASIIDCNNLWVEATIDSNITKQLNSQEPVIVDINHQNLSLQGKISLIESLNKIEKESHNSDHQTAIITEIPSQEQTQNYSRVMVTVPSQKLHQQQFCSVGQTAQLFFNKEKDSVVSHKLISYVIRDFILTFHQWQPEWLSKILAIISQ